MSLSFHLTGSSTGLAATSVVVVARAKIITMLKRMMMVCSSEVRMRADSKRPERRLIEIVVCL
jgi:hypothetical protein